MESKAAARPIASAPPVPGDAAAERRVRDFLGQGKWRKARDEVKPLVKRDCARYLLLLGCDGNASPPPHRP